MKTPYLDAERRAWWVCIRCSIVVKDKEIQRWEVEIVACGPVCPRASDCRKQQTGILGSVKRKMPENFEKLWEVRTDSENKDSTKAFKADSRSVV